MTTSHTSGPWIRIGSKVPGNGETMVVTADYKKIIASTAFNLPQDESESNAKLIAAAPDLLEACKEAVNQCAGFGNDATVARWKAAIAKAS